MTDSTAGLAPQQLARLAGALYLVNIVAGAFAIGVVPGILVARDLSGTADNIQAHELLYRLGLAAHVVVTATNVPMALIFYELFKVVNRRLALLDVFFGLVATAIEAASLLGQFTSVILLSGSDYRNALAPAQLHALAALPQDLSTTDYSVYTVFYGFDFVIVAYLVLRSTFLPRTIGVLLAVDALTYLVHGFTTILAPGVAANLGAWTGLPTIAAEGSLCLWLLVAGVNVQRWKERAGAVR